MEQDHLKIYWKIIFNLKNYQISIFVVNATNLLKNQSKLYNFGELLNF